MLILCPTPIGNLGDITLRQREALESADRIACEDTRRTGKLLELLGIPRIEGRPALLRYDDHSKETELDRVIALLKGGERIVLVSDAGTPTISDPGYGLVRRCRQEGIAVEALPGPVAAMVALSGSGLPSDRFFFEGFLPSSSAERENRLREVLSSFGEVTSIFYESPYRILDTLKTLVVLGEEDRQIALVRELTKMHEEYLVGTLNEVLREVESRDQVKGELVLLLGPKKKEGGQEEVLRKTEDEAMRAMLDEGLSKRTIKELMHRLYEMPRSSVYGRLEELAKA